MIIIASSGNCNFSYISGLAYYVTIPDKVMLEVLTQPVAPMNTKNLPPAYRKPTGGFFLFAQGSEDPVTDRPYGPNFKKFIEDQKLGKVTEISSPNPMHGGKTAILYVWKVDHAQCAAWWDKNVFLPWHAERAEFDKINKAML